MSHLNGNTTIPPMLLANFNPYELLEPQKNEPHNEPQVGRLIDIDGITNTNDHVFLPDQKTDFDLIDLFQNILVSPQFIKNKSTIKPSSNGISKPIDNDFKDFFDKLEFGTSINECQLLNNLKEEGKSQEDFKDDDEDSDPEDLIYQLIAQKSREKNYLKEYEAPDSLHSVKSDSPKLTEFPTIKVLKAPPDITLKLASGNSTPNKKETPTTSKQSSPNSDLRAEFARLELNNDIPNNLNTRTGIEDNVPNPKLERQITNTSNFKVIGIKKDEKAYKKKCILKPVHQTMNYTKGADFNEKAKVLPGIMNRVMATRMYLEDQQNKKRPLILDSREGSSKTTSLKSVGSAESIPCCNKKIETRRLNILTSDDVADSLTDELIDQILAHKRESLNGFIMKSYNPEPSTPTTLKQKPETDLISELARMKCNKVGENLTKAGVAEQITNTPRFSVIAIKKDEKVYRKKRLIKPVNQTVNYTKGADFSEKSIVLPQMMERIVARQVCLEQKLNQKKRLVLDSGVGNPKVENNVASAKKSPCNCGKRDAETTTFRGGAVLSNSSFDQTFGQLSPIVLMEDCNKERLRALRQSQMFKNFIYNGTP